MRPFILHREQFLPRPVEEVFPFFADACNLEEITPPWLGFQIVTLPPRMEEGAEIVYRIRWHGFPMSWKTVISRWRPGVEFVDEQKVGPYVLWHHTHSFWPEKGGTRIIDHVQYRLPFGPLGKLVRKWIVGPDLERIFDYRQRRIAQLFAVPLVE